VATTALSTAQLDEILTAQLAVAWAGEAGIDNPRLGWWQTALDEEFGGHDLFDRLLPRTGRWAALVGARRAAIAHDRWLRRQNASEPDTLRTLFHFGFAVDEQLDDRLRDLHLGGAAPHEALRGLVELLGPLDPASPHERRSFDAGRFAEWCDGHDGQGHKVTAIGRQVTDAPPAALASRLVAALAPLADAYPLPYARSAA
jgi:hypothetical protein